MHHFFVSPDQIGESEIWLGGSDVNHIRNVLRMEAGEQICVSNGVDSKEYRCELNGFEKDRITAKIMWIEEVGMELPSKIYLFQGLPKSDKMELIIQKAVELGVYEIIPVATKRAVVKLDEKKEQSKRKRWNTISESAAKQSKRMVIPEVKKVMSFKESAVYAAGLDIKLIPYELENGMAATKQIVDAVIPGRSIAVFIGPEGGFAEEEIELAREYGMKPVSLGKRILRTETAGLAVLSILMYHLETKQVGECNGSIFG